MDAPSHDPSPCEPRFALRRGFSLIELLVAILVVDVGVLALAGSTLALVRERTELRARAAAIRAAAARLDWLGAGPCRPASGSAETSPLIVERWHAELRPNATLELSDSVTFDAGGVHAVVLRSRVPC